MAYRALAFGLMVPLGLGACKAINPAYEQDDEGGTATPPTTTEAPPLTSSGTTEKPPGDDGVMTSGSGMGTTDGVLDTGGEEVGSSGDELDCEPSDRPIDITLTNGKGMTLNPDNSCSDPFYFNGGYVAIDHGLEVRLCCGCDKLRSYLIDFGTSLSLPAKFEGCGEIGIWPGFDINGECRWMGLALFDQSVKYDPIFVGSNTFEVPPWPENDIKILGVPGCELDPASCGAQPTGIQDMLVNDTYLIPPGGNADIPMGSGVEFSFTNRMSNVDDECRTRISWMAHQ